MNDESKEAQLIGWAKMLDLGRINAKKYQEHKNLLIGDGEDIPDPDLATIRATLKEERDAATRPPESSKTHEEWERYYLKEIAAQAETQTKLLSFIKAWVVFFGVLTIVSLVMWVIITAGGI